MQITEREEEGVIVVSVTGEVDLETSPQLRTLLKSKASSAGARVVLDLAGASYMDSSGMATLIEFYQLAKENGGRLVLARLTSRVRNALEIVRLHEIFELHDDLADALTAALK